MTKATRISRDDYNRNKALLIGALATGEIDVVILTRQKSVRGGESETADVVCLTPLSAINNQCNTLRTIKDHALGFSYMVLSVGYTPEFGEPACVNLNADSVALQCLACMTEDLGFFGYDPETFEMISFESLKPVELKSEAVSQLHEPGSRMIYMGTTTAADRVAELGQNIVHIVGVGPKDRRALEKLFRLAAAQGRSVTAIVEALEEGPGVPAL